MKNLAKLVEKIFYPSNVIITAGIIFLIYFMNDIHSFNNNIAFIISAISYGILILLMKKKNKNENYRYFLASTTAMIIFFILGYFFTISNEFFFAASSVFILSIIIFSIRTKWKISGHCSSFTGVVTIMTLIEPRFLIAYIFYPLVAWSRLKLKAHDLLQVILGTLIGFLIPIILSVIS